MKKRLLLGLLLSQCAWGSLESSYQEGQAYTSQLQEKAKTELGKTNLKDIPKFESATPKESGLYENAELGEAIQQVLPESEAGKTVIDTAKTRERFKIDPTTDPLFKVEHEETAEQRLNIKNGLIEDHPTDVVEKICEEGGDEIEMECHDTLEIKTQEKETQTTLKVGQVDFLYSVVLGTKLSNVLIGPQIGNAQISQFYHYHSLFENNNLNFFITKACPTLVASGLLSLNCNNVKKYTFTSSLIPGYWATAYTITIHYMIPEIASEEWHSSCDTADSMVDEGYCQLLERTCQPGPKTRMINGLSVTRDCWQYVQRYKCKMIKDDCSALRAQGCYQKSSKCKELKQGRCWIYEQTYHCPNEKRSLSKIKSPPLEAFCLTGDCHNASYQVNNDMLNVMSRLNMLKEIQNDIRAQGNNFFQIFKGTQQACSRNCISFKDCCGGLKGWGVSLHIAGCTAEEKALAKLREQNLCHQIGTYCAKKILKKCVSKKTTFCCFGTKFSRLLQEQGRAQLGLRWGTAECPDCRGFTVEELSRMDLSKMDFRELFQEVMQRYHQPDLKALQEKTGQKVQENVKSMEQGLLIKKPKSGVLEGYHDGL